MVITRKNQVLLRYVKLRVIINGMYIYPLQEKKPVVIALPTNKPNIVASDGFHITRPIEIASQTRVDYLKVGCAIEDDHLIAGAIITFFLYLVGFTSGVLIITLISFFPVFYFLYLYYVNRKEFFQIQRV